MLPVIAIVGRPNVGKSTLFNRFTHSRQALVSDAPGLTRDRQYGLMEYHDKNFIIADTGGIDDEDKSATAVTNASHRTRTNSIAKLIAKQSWQAVCEAEIVLLVVDARAGLVPSDMAIVERLRKISATKKIFLAVNKIDGLNNASLTAAVGEFYKFGLHAPYLISAEHGDGVRNLLDEIAKASAKQTSSDEAIEAITPDGQSVEQALEKAEETKKPSKSKKTSSNINSTISDNRAAVKIAFIGRPNVGKSTLVNRILGEERVIVSEEAGTTRDSIFINFTRRNKPYTLIDTAGIRRRGRVTDKIEKFSIIKSLQAIAACNVVVLVLDAQTSTTEQDLHLLGFALDSGRALVIAVNKWDGLSTLQRQTMRDTLDRRLTFIDFAPIHFISALHGTGVGDLFPSIDKAYASATKILKTPDVTRILIKAVADFPPPLSGGRRIKLRYAHVGGHNPPIIVIHGNQTDQLPASYRKYLEREFRHKLRLVGTPIRIELKNSANPYCRDEGGKSENRKGENRKSKNKKKKTRIVVSSQNHRKT